MKKTEEKKLKEKIVKLIGNNYTDTDDLLVMELIYWLKIKEKSRKELEKSVVHDGEMSWKELGTLSMCNRIILSTLKALGVTPYERMKGKKEEKPTFDLNKFLNEN